MSFPPIHRVVTGHDVRGKAIFVINGPLSIIRELESIPGMIFHEVWETCVHAGDRRQRSRPDTPGGCGFLLVFVGRLTPLSEPLPCPGERTSQILGSGVRRRLGVAMVPSTTLAVVRTNVAICWASATGCSCCGPCPACGKVSNCTVGSCPLSVYQFSTGNEMS